PGARCPGFVLPVEREARAIGGPAAAADLRDVEVGRDVPAMRAMKLDVTIDGHGIPPRTYLKIACAARLLCRVLARRSLYVRVLSRGSLRAFAYSGCSAHFEIRSQNAAN